MIAVSWRRQQQRHWADTCTSKAGIANPLPTVHAVHSTPQYFDPCHLSTVHCALFPAHHPQAAVLRPVLTIHCSQSVVHPTHSSLHCLSVTYSLLSTIQCQEGGWDRGRAFSEQQKSERQRKASTHLLAHRTDLAYGTGWYSVMWCATARHDKAGHGLAWHGMVSYGMVCSGVCNGMAW